MTLSYSFLKNYSTLATKGPLSAIIIFKRCKFNKTVIVVLQTAHICTHFIKIPNGFDVTSGLELPISFLVDNTCALNEVAD